MQENSQSRKLHILITVAVMVFIFVHSAMPGDMSGNESRYFAEILASITGMSMDIATFIVRKAAHFTEYVVLGGCLLINVRDWNLRADNALEGRQDRNLRADNAIKGRLDNDRRADNALEGRQDRNRRADNAIKGRHGSDRRADNDPEGRQDRDRRAENALKGRQVWGLAWILAAAYAFTDELHQRFVPGRSCELRDVCIDAAGAAIGSAIMLLILMRQDRKARQSDPQ